MNIILISVDSLRPDFLGCYGSQRLKTPALDRLAEESQIYEYAFCQTPYTVPSHATIFTGLYPFNHGLQKQYGLKLSPQIPTVFSLLTGRGYICGAFSGALGVFQRYGYELQAEWQAGTELAPIGRWLAACGTSPFFLFLHLWETHIPYQTIVWPRNWRERFTNGVVRVENLVGRRLDRRLRRRLPLQKEADRVAQVASMVIERKDWVRERVIRGYCHSVRLVDCYIDRLIALLRRLNLLDRTAILFTSDHGEGFNECQEVRESPWYTHGYFLYDNAIRVPLLVRLPPGSLAPGRVTRLVEHVDLLPTMLDLARNGRSTALEEEVRPDGTSLLQDSRKEQIYAETFIELEWKARKRCLRTQTHKIIMDLLLRRTQVFDLVQDPGEQEDVAATRPALTDEMTLKLDAFLQAAQRGDFFQNRMDPQEEQEIKDRLRSLGYL